MNKKLLVAISVLSTVGAMAVTSCDNAVGEWFETNPVSTWFAGPFADWFKEGPVTTFFKDLFGGNAGENTGHSTADTTDTTTGTDTTGTDTTPVVDPVSDIEVTTPEEDIIVGDILNLDSYVNVVGGTGPKDYTVTVRAVSADVVTLEGHTLTVLKEGQIALKVEAGAESVLINWESLSREKAALKAYTQEAASEYALYDVYTDEEGYLDFAGTGVKHNDNYFYSYTYNSTARDNVGEGMILLGDGKMYDFTADSLEGENFKVLEGGASGANWENYFVNMDNPIDYTTFETVTEDDYTYLVCDSSVPAPAGMEDYAANMPAYILLCAYGYRLNATNCPADTYQVVVEDLGDGMLLLEIMFEYSQAIISRYGDAYAGPQIAEMALLGGPEDSKLLPAEAYLASGEIPQALTFDELTTAYTAMDTAKNYTVDVTAGWFSTPTVTGTPVSNPLQAYGYQDFVPAAVDTVKVTEVSYAGEAAEVVASLETLSIAGREEEADGSVTFSFVGDDAEDFITAVFAASGAIGQTLNNYVPQLWSYGNTMFDGYVNVGADYVEFDVGFTWNTGVYYRFNAVFSAVGTTTLA